MITPSAQRRKSVSVMSHPARMAASKAASVFGGTSSCTPQLAITWMRSCAIASILRAATAGPAETYFPQFMAVEQPHSIHVPSQRSSGISSELEARERCAPPSTDKSSRPQGVRRPSTAVHLARLDADGQEPEGRVLDERC